MADPESDLSEACGGGGGQAERNPTSIWGQVCEILKWWNCQQKGLKNRKKLRTIWNQNRGGIRQLTAEIKKSRKDSILEGEQIYKEQKVILDKREEVMEGVTEGDSEEDKEVIKSEKQVFEEETTVVSEKGTEVLEEEVEVSEDKEEIIREGEQVLEEEITVVLKEVTEVLEEEEEASEDKEEAIRDGKQVVEEETAVALEEGTEVLEEEVEVSEDKEEAIRDGEQVVEEEIAVALEEGTEVLEEEVEVSEDKEEAIRDGEQVVEEETAVALEESTEVLEEEEEVSEDKEEVIREGEQVLEEIAVVLEEGTEVLGEEEEVSQVKDEVIEEGEQVGEQVFEEKKEHVSEMEQQVLQEGEEVLMGKDNVLEREGEEAAKGNGNVCDFEEARKDVSEEEEDIEETQSSHETDVMEDTRKECVYLNVPETWVMKLSPKDWADIKPKTSQNKLGTNYTNILRKEFIKTNPYCVLVFSGSNRVKKQSSRKYASPYWKGIGRCKVMGCCKYSFTIAENPSDKMCKIHVTRLGEATHFSCDTQKTPLTGEVRQAVGKEVKEIGAHTYHMNKLGVTPEAILLAGNLSTVQSPQVLQQIINETRRGEKLHFNPIIDLCITAELTAKLDEQNKLYPGYVRHISIQPMCVHLHMEQNLKILSEATGRRLLHLDATGSLVSRLQDLPTQKQTILYYAVVFPHAKKGQLCLPVTEMVSWSHDTLTISSWLTRFMHDLGKVKTRKGNNGFIVVTDFSWAQIHSVIKAFNSTNLRDYFHKVDQILNGEQSAAEIERFTVVQLCAAHFLKMIADKIAHEVKNSKLRHFFLFCVARLVQCDNKSEAVSLYQNMCKAFVSKKTSPVVVRSVDYLKKAISKQEDPVSILESAGASFSEDLEDLLNPTVRQMSPFTILFDQIMAEASEETDDPEPDNSYYFSYFMKFHMQYMHLFPFFSAVILDPERYSRESMETREKLKDSEVKTLTNGEVEGWMAVVKRDIFKKRKNNHVGKFIRTMYYHHRGLNKEFKGIAKKRQSSPISEWGPKGQKKAKIFSSYFEAKTPPEVIKKGRKKTVTKEKVFQIILYLMSQLTSAMESSMGGVHLFHLPNC